MSLLQMSEVATSPMHLLPFASTFVSVVAVSPAWPWLSCIDSAGLFGFQLQSYSFWLSHHLPLGNGIISLPVKYICMYDCVCVCVAWIASVFYLPSLPSSKVRLQLQSVSCIFYTFSSWIIYLCCNICILAHTYMLIKLRLFQMSAFILFQWVPLPSSFLSH